MEIMEIQVGTTPKIEFEVLDFDTSIISKERIVFTQGEEVVLKKETEDCKIEGNIISAKLSQEETMLFNETEDIKLQLRVKTLGGEVLQTDPIFTSVGELLDNEVL